MGIQNDPSNGNRALRLLAAYKLITLKPEAEQKNTATPVSYTHLDVYKRQP